MKYGKIFSDFSGDSNWSCRIFLYQGNTDGVFIAAVLGAVSFFLSVRFQVKERLKLRETNETAESQENNLQG